MFKNVKKEEIIVHKLLSNSRATSRCLPWSQKYAKYIIFAIKYQWSWSINIYLQNYFIRFIPYSSEYNYLFVNS